MDDIALAKSENILFGINEFFFSLAKYTIHFNINCRDYPKSKIFDERTLMFDCRQNIRG